MTESGVVPAGLGIDVPLPLEKKCAVLKKGGELFLNGFSKFHCLLTSL